MESGATGDDPQPAARTASRTTGSVCRMRERSVQRTGHYFQSLHARSGSTREEADLKITS